MAVTSVNGLVDALLGVYQNPEINRLEALMTKETNADWTAAAAREAMAEYTTKLSDAIVEPTKEYMLSDEFISLSNSAKAEIVRDIVQPAVVDVFDLCSSNAKLYYDELFYEADSAQRAVQVAVDFERIEGITAQVIKKAIDEEGEPSDPEGAGHLAAGAINNVTQSAMRRTVVETAERYQSKGFEAYRFNKSLYPCDLCALLDGVKINIREIDSPIMEFHDNCNCELVIYVTS